MAESTLAVTFDDLRAEVAHFLGWQRTPSTWTAGMKQDLDAYVKSGLRNVYYPPMLQGEAYEWSFLKPVRSLTLVADQYVYDLPDDLAFIDGPLTFAGDSSSLAVQVPVVGEGTIRLRRGEQPSSTGRPTLAAMRPKRPATSGQRFELVVWPTPDAEYEIEFAYSVHPDALSEARQYPYGGAAHAETLIASCLAVAESRHDDGATTDKAEVFIKRLTASMAADRRFKPATLGYNRDGSDDLTVCRRRGGTVTYLGVEY